MSLHLSAWSKKPHVVIVLSLLGLGVVFGGMGFVLSSALTLLCTLNPYVLLAEYTAQVVSPGGGFAGPGISCATHVAIMAAAAGAFTLAAMIRLRSRALKLAFGAESVKQTARQKARGQRRHAAAQERAIMHVDRPPLIWRGTLSDRISGRRLRVATYTILAFGTVAYAICYIGIMQNPGGSWNRFYAFLMFFAMGLNFIAQLRTASMAASSVAGEKEAKTLPILLTLPISDQELLASKETIAFRRNLPLWILVAWIGLVGVFVASVFSFRATPAPPESEVVAAWNMVYRLILLALVPLAIAAVTVMFRALYRGMPVNIKRKTLLIVLTACVLLSLLYATIHPRGVGIGQLLFMPMLLVAQIYQSIGLGLYCGCRSRTTTRAIVLTFIGILMILFLENFVFMGILRVVVMWLQGAGAFAMRFFSFGYLLVHLLVQTVVAWWCYKQAKKWFRKDLFSGA